MLDLCLTSIGDIWCGSGEKLSTSQSIVMHMSFVLPYKCMDKRSNTIQIRTTTGEQKMVESLCDRLGGIPKSDLIRRLIQERFRKEFPVYIVNKKGNNSPLEVNLTNEQKCERRGGKPVRDGAGNSICEFRKPGTGIVGTVSMSNPEGFDAMADRIGL